MNSTEKDLQDLGISPAESKVYLALLKLGNAKVGQVITLVDISSSNVHKALEKLTKKGLISFITKNQIKEYFPSSPKNLQSLIEKDKQKVAKKEDNLKILLNKIKSIQKFPELDQNAEVYIGFNGIKSAFKKLLNNKPSEFLFFYKHNAEGSDKIHDFFSRMELEKDYRKIPTKGIFSKEYKKLFGKRKSRIKAKFTNNAIPSSVNICNNKTLIISWGDNPIAFLIESKEISNMFKELFEEIWKNN
jgi:HTH-type transcriptional regulator, sugar sensing transcriptional regulator